MIVLLVIAAAALVGVVLPEAAWAWGPGTHLKLADIVFLNRGLLPREIADLIGRFPGLYFYGNIIADLILGKAVGIDYEDHSHNWEVGFRLLERAEAPQLRAVTWGYLSHLAADVVAHNLYVPAQFVHSSPGRGRGHAFWEMHYDGHVPDPYAAAAIRVQNLGRHHADRFLMRELAQTIFPHRTNRWIFSGTIVVQQFRAYRQLARRSIERSPYRVAPNEVDFFDDLSLRAIADVLTRGRIADVTHYDPTGHEAQRQAKESRLALRRARADRATPRDWPPAPDRDAARQQFLNGLDRLPSHPFDSHPLEHGSHPLFRGRVEPDDV